MPEYTVIAAVDNAEVEALVSNARLGDATSDPPLDPTDDAMEIARRVVKVLDFKRADPQSDDVSRNAAYSNIRALAVTGAGAVARRVLRSAAPFQVKRNGQLTTLSTIFSVPSHLISAQQRTAGEAPDVPVAEEAEDGPARLRRTQYIQLDFATWELIEWLRNHLTALRDGVGITVSLLDDILSLKDKYPGCSPREAMLKAGLDPTTMEIDLDRALASLDRDDDVGIQDTTG